MSDPVARLLQEQNTTDDDPVAALLQTNPPGDNLAPRPSDVEDPDGYLEMLGKQAIAGLVELPRGIATLGSLGERNAPVGERTVTRARAAMDGVILDLEPNFGPESDKPYRGAVLDYAQRNVKSDDERLAPRDVGAFASAAGYTGGFLAGGLAGNLLARAGTLAVGKGIVAIAPKLALRANARVASVAAKAGSLAGRLQPAHAELLGQQVSAAVRAAPLELASGLGQQGLTDPESLGTPAGVGQGILFSLLGGLSAGPVFGRAKHARIAEREGTTAEAVAAREGSPAEGPLPKSVKDKSPEQVTDVDVLNSSPQELRDAVKSARKQERAGYEGLFGEKGAKLYRRMVKVAESPQSKPEDAARALEIVDRMRGKLSAESQSALDALGKRGYTAARLNAIEKKVRDYSSETLDKVDSETLAKQFGEVLMEKGQERNVAGLYRLYRINEAIVERGERPSVLLKGAFQHLVDQGMSAEKALPAVLDAMDRTKKYLDNLTNESATPTKPGYVDPEPTAEVLREAKLATVGPEKVVVQVPSVRASLATGTSESIDTPTPGEVVSRNPDGTVKVKHEDGSVRTYDGTRVEADPSTPSKPIDMDDVVSAMASTGEGQVGAKLDPSLFKKLGANMYKGKLDGVIVKEGMQNSIDAVRGLPPGEGRIEFDIDTWKNTVIMSDNGIGMTPEVAANQFMDVGGSAKQAGASGGYGMAKVGLLSSAKHFEMVTVAKVGNEKVRTTISGSADDWIGGTLKYTTEQVDPNYMTGTSLKIEVEREAITGWDDALEFLDHAVRYSDLGIDVKWKTNGRDVEIDPDAYGMPQIDPALVKTINIPGATATVKRSIKDFDSEGGYMRIFVLNNGLFQFRMFEHIKGADVPHAIVVDVRPTVGVDDSNYPFTTSREELKGEITPELKAYFANISGAAAVKEVRGMAVALYESPQIKTPAGDFVTLGTGKGGEQEVQLLRTISSRGYAKELSWTMSDLIEGIYRIVKQDRVIEPPAFAGMGIHRGWLGVNIDQEGLAQMARDQGVAVTGMFANKGEKGKLPRLIFFNPFVSFLEITKTGDINKASQMFAARAWGTLVHEVAHQRARGHTEDFAGELTRMIGETSDLAVQGIPQLKKIFYAMFQSGEFLSDAAEVTDVWKRVGQSKHVLSKIAGHQRSPGDLHGDAPLGDASGNDLPMAERLASSGGESRTPSGEAVPTGKRTGLTGRRGPSPKPGDAAQRQARSAPESLSNPTDAVTKRLPFDPRDPLEITHGTANLPPHSSRIQDHIQVEPPSPEAPFWKRPMSELYQMLFRRSYGIEKAVETVTLGKLSPGENPAIAARLTSGTVGRGEQMLKFGTFRILPGGDVQFTGGRGFAQIIAPFKGRMNEVRRAMIAKRVIEVGERDIPTGISVEDARLEIANARPDVMAAVDESVKYRDSVLQYAVDAGLLSERSALVMRRLGNTYVSLERALPAVEKTPSGKIQYAALATKQQFHKLVGSKLRIVDPIRTTVDYTRRVMRAADLNRVGLQLVEMAEKYPDMAIGLIERQKDLAATYSPEIAGVDTFVKEAQKVGIDLPRSAAKELAALFGNKGLAVEGDMMRVWRGGKVEQWKLHPQIGDALRGLGPQEIGFVAQLIGVPSQVMKVGVTQNPIFGALQAFVGTFHAAVQSQHGFIPVVSSMEGLYHRLANTKYRQEFMAGGGAFGSLSAAEYTSTASATRAVLPLTLAGRVAQGAMHPVDALRALTAPLEEASRLGEFALARRKGKSVLEASVAARDIDTDFSMIGTRMAAAAHMVAFLNPFLQATDTVVRAAIKHPLKTTLMGTAAIGIPSLLLKIAAEGDQEVQDLQRGSAGINNWILRMPGGEIAQLRKPYVWGAVFGNGIEYAYDRMKGENPRALDTLKKALVDNIMFYSLPNIITLIEGLATNYDRLGRAPIVPEDVQDVDPEFQVTERTSEAAQFVGKSLDLSPVKIDFAIRQLGGTLGVEAARAVGALIPDGKISKPTPVSADWPLVGRLFARYPSSGVEPLRTFYTDASEMVKKYNTLQLLINQNRVEEATAYAKDHEVELGYAPIYGQVREELAKFRQTIDEIKSMPDDALTSQQKRELTDYVMRNMISHARAVNDAVYKQRGQEVVR